MPRNPALTAPRQRDSQTAQREGRDRTRHGATTRGHKARTLASRRPKPRHRTRCQATTAADGAHNPIEHAGCATLPQGHGKTIPHGTGGKKGGRHKQATVTASLEGRADGNTHTRPPRTPAARTTPAATPSQEWRGTTQQGPPRRMASDHPAQQSRVGTIQRIYTRNVHIRVPYRKNIVQYASVFVARV